MSPDRQAPEGAASLPESLVLEQHGAVAVLRLSRPQKRNALDDPTVLGLQAFFERLPTWVRAVVLDSEGPHFCAGLDLSELRDRDAMEGLQHSRMWHRAFEAVEKGPVPVVSVLRGAVIGGGLELACATHVRVAEPSAMFALPEGQRGLFVGGGGSVRIPRLIGVSRMTDLMLTGRVLTGQEGHDMGLAQYLAPEGAGLETALGLAQRMTENAPMTNFAVLQALPRIAESSPEVGLLLESFVASASGSSPEAQRRMAEFLAGRAAKVTG